MRAIDLTHVFEKFKGQWVAFDNDYNVVSANKSAKKVYKEAKKKGYLVPRLFNVPKTDLPFFGYHV